MPAGRMENEHGSFSLTHHPLWNSGNQNPVPGATATRLVASWLPFLPSSPFCLHQQFSQYFHFHCLAQADSFGCCTWALTKLSVTSGPWMIYRNPQLSYQVTAGISITWSYQHLSSCLLLSSEICFLSTQLSQQFLVHLLECCTSIKHSTPNTCGIHHQLQRSSGWPKSTDSALSTKLLSPFWDSWCLGLFSPWWLPPDTAEPGHASATGTILFFQQLCSAPITSWNGKT